jgi:hypothetical protein
MKNRSLVTALRQFSPELNIRLKAQLQYGCTEVGYGSGEYSGLDFSQEYSIEWQEGYLFSEGYTVKKLIDVLTKKILSKISNADFDLKPGELKNGDETKYKTTWKNGKHSKIELPDDYHLHNIMNFGDSEYKWQSAKYIEIEVIYLDQTGEELSIFFVLNEDEVDIKPDQLKANK